MKAKKITEFLLSVLVAFCCILGATLCVFNPLTAKAWVAYTQGKDFNKQGYYHMENKLNLTGADDFTIDCEIWIPQEHYGWRNGVLFSDYLNDGTRIRGSYLEFFTHGGIYVSIENGPEFMFDTTYLNTDYVGYFGTLNEPKTAHFSFVIDMEDVANSNTTKYLLYINGELKETVTEDSPLMLRKGAHLNQGELSTWDTVCIGGDRRIGNSMALTGRIQSLAMYKDVRTAAEISASAQATAFSVDTTDDKLLAAYDMMGENFATDLSKNSNDLVYQPIVGATFTNDYPLQQKVSATPTTVETWLYVPTANNSYVGAMISNYSDAGSGVPFYSWEIYQNGMPRLTYIDASGKVVRHEFTDVDVRTNDWAHLVLTHTGTELKCYLNGVLKQTATVATSRENPIGTTVTAFHSNIAKTPLCVGGDTRTGNTCYFKGYIRDVAVFSDVRTDAEIANDYKSVNLTADGLTGYYDLTKVTPDVHVVEDLTANKNTLERLWLTESVLDLDKYAYSFAVIGDPQKLLYYDLKDGTDNMTYIFNWLSDPNVIAEKKLKYVFGMGDTTDSRNVDKEYEYSAREHQKLTDAGIPWQFVQGNHDELPYYDRYFGQSENWKNLDIHYYTGVSERPGRQNYYIDNPTNLGSFYVNFTIGKTDWMFFTLDYGVEDNILEWASEEIWKNPTRRVIITTHAYIDGQGNYLDGSQESCPSEIHNSYNDGIDIWEKLIRKHRNIVMVLCGHCGTDDVLYRQDYTDCGTKVTQMLVNPQTFDATYDYKTGMVALLHFTEDGMDVGVEYYSTVRGQYYKLVNQFEFDLIDYYGNGIYEIQNIENDDGTTTLRYLYTNGTYEDVIIKNPVNGTNGVDGKTPYIGENGNWFIGDTDTGVKAQGTNGTNGTNGITPHIGTNGNWFIGDTDTGVKAQGSIGINGEVPYIGANGNWFVGATDTGVKAQGENGADGQTPYIGTNGNWWIGDTDTGVKAMQPETEDVTCTSSAGGIGVVFVALILGVAILCKKRKNEI